MPPQLTNFLEIKVDLPDGRRATVSSMTPISNNDTFFIEKPINEIGNASSVGFVEDTTGGTVSAPTFYVGTNDQARIQDRKGQNITVVTLNAGDRVNYVAEES